MEDGLEENIKKEKKTVGFNASYTYKPQTP